MINKNRHFKKGMNINKIKKEFKKIIPNFVLRFVTGLFYGWRGNYSSWHEAEKKSSGYDLQNILEKVKESTLKVKNGIVPYERDSVTFNKIQYSFPLLSELMWIAAQNEGSLNVLDFGGSLGSSYYQNKRFLDDLKQVNWYIVEQENFVKVGLETFSDDRLHFYYSIDECLKSHDIDVILLSSVLQYIEEPYKLLEIIINKNFKYIIFDRTAFITKADRVTIQKVHPAIYKASYPCWFFNESKFISFMKEDYDLIVDFIAFGSANIISEFKGFIFKNKNATLF